VLDRRSLSQPPRFNNRGFVAHRKVLNFIAYKNVPDFIRDVFIMEENKN